MGRKKETVENPGTVYKEKVQKQLKEKREEKLEQEKVQEKKDEKELQNYAKSSTYTKRTSVWADSLEKLIEKIKAVDWENVKAEKTPENGSRFDYSI
ncbi:MAG: DUF6033 family protein [Lachnospiraceae bacterium]